MLRLERTKKKREFSLGKLFVPLILDNSNSTKVGFISIPLIISKDQESNTPRRMQTICAGMYACNYIVYTCIRVIISLW